MAQITVAGAAGWAERVTQGARDQQDDQVPRPALARTSRGPLRGLLLLAALAALAAGTAVAGPAASASGPESAVAAPDFAWDVHADPWDFAGPSDLLLDTGPTMKLEQPRIADGLLRFGLGQEGYVSPLWGGYPGGLYLDREAGAPDKRLDADRYTHVSMHAYASQAVPAGLMWWSCEGLDRGCMGGQQFLLRQGWNTYNIAVRNGGFGLPQEWTGAMTGLRLAISPSQPTDLAIDWMRVYAPTTTLTAPRDAVWDTDPDLSNNGPGVPGWGPVRCGGAETCDLSYLPAGTYWITHGGTTRGPVVLRRPARPVVLDPDLVGGVDVAADDPWDFATGSDVAGGGNVADLTFGERLTGQNAEPVMNDPYVWLNTHGRLIDTERFHRATVRSGYEGPFRLEDEAGGGTMARIVWHHQAFAGVQQTEDIVTYSGTRTVTVDLSAPGTHETDNDPEFDIPWQTLPADGVRWDPNEDHGPRRWWLERFALRADDEAGTSYRVRWYDAGYAPGSTVRLYRDSDAAGFDGVEVSPTLSQKPGTNAYDWDTRDVPPGRYWVYAVVQSPTGVASSYSTGPVHVLGPVMEGQAPSPVVPLTRELLAACPQHKVPASRLPDVPPGNPHRAAVDCLAWWQVTRPPAAGYLPAGQVTRGQMASFLRRVVEGTGQSLPAGRDAFSDDDGSTHEAAVDALAHAGVVTGYGDGTYRPQEPVSRAQMATFLVRAAELRLSGPLPEAADYFTDDEHSAHRRSVDKAAGAGITGGTAEGRYSPDALVRRDQMASFLVRLLDLLVSSGRGTAPVG